MFLLLFRLGNDTYALDTSRVVEIIPLVEVRSLAHAVKGIAGVIDYRGAIVPVIDLSMIATGAPSRRVSSTRIAIVRYEADLLGLVLERALRTVRKSLSDFVPSRVEVPDAPYFGKVSRDRDGIIQNVELDQLLPPDVRERIYFS